MSRISKQNMCTNYTLTYISHAPYILTKQGYKLQLDAIYQCYFVNYHPFSLIYVTSLLTIKNNKYFIYTIHRPSSSMVINVDILSC